MLCCSSKKPRGWYGIAHTLPNFSALGSSPVYYKEEFLDTFDSISVLSVWIHFYILTSPLMLLKTESNNTSNVLIKLNHSSH